MSLRDLKYIIAIAESRHFGKAAERCFVSQPTLNGRIKKLKAEAASYFLNNGFASPFLPWGSTRPSLLSAL